MQLVLRKPDVWIVAFTAFGYMSKWGWWDIQFTTWCVQEFQWGIETSSLLMGMLAGIFAVLVPLGGWLGDHPRGNRILIMAVSLATLAGIYCFMGPWQLQWALETRRSVLVPYIVLEGLLCPLLEPIFLPQMIDSAMEDYEDKNAVDEHLTNFVTSIFQTAFNLGQVTDKHHLSPIHFFIYDDKNLCFQPVGARAVSRRPIHRKLWLPWSVGALGSGICCSKRGISSAVAVEA